MPGSPELTDELKAIACDAARDLSWLAATHAVLRTPTINLSEHALALLAYPDKFTDKRIANCFRTFQAYLVRPPRDGPGHYLNKAAVVYAVAVLEAFLQDSHHAVFGRSMEGRSLSAYAKTIEGHVHGFTDNAKAALFLAQLRHVIVHNHGRVDKKFLDKAKPIRDTAIWPDSPGPDAVSFDSDYIEGQQVCLDVAKVIIPYLDKAVQFVDYAQREFRKLADKKGSGQIPET